jgi:hypothetical protein
MLFMTVLCSVCLMSRLCWNYLSYRLANLMVYHSLDDTAADDSSNQTKSSPKKSTPFLNIIIASLLDGFLSFLRYDGI